MIDEVRDQLIEYLEDAHALEQHVRHQLDVVIETTEDPEFNQLFRLHVVETERHERSLVERLAAYNRSPSPVKEAGAIFTAMSKGLVDKLRHPTTARNARDAYVAEHLEIASYALLEHLATHAGDWATVEVAKRNGADERRMANEIAARWERAVHTSLPRPRTRT
jgi:ferritin-like metal-binding protein YciE